MAEKGLATSSRRWPHWVSLARRWSWNPSQKGLLAVLVLLSAVFAVLSAPFRDVDNFLLIASEVSMVGIVAAAQTLVILIGGMDLSVGSMTALAGIAAASLMKGWGPLPPLHPYLAIALALGLGAAVGLAHGWLIAKRNAPPFILTLASLSILRGLALAWSNASPINLLPDEFKWIADGEWGAIPVPVLIMIGTFVALGYTLRNTKFGRYTYAVGGNEMAARLSGVPVDRVKIAIYMLSGTLAALAGIILIARLDGGFYTNGEGYELSSVAAVIIGGTSLTGGVGGVWGTLLGVSIMAVVRNGLVMVGISPLWHSLFIGGIILVAVLVDIERRRARQSPSPVQAQPGATDRSYLDEVMIKTRRLIKERVGSPHARVYMLDPHSEDLVECRADAHVTVQAGSIADQVCRTGQAVVLQRLSVTGHDQMAPLSPDVQSAAAVPLMWNGQIAGVLEVQSLLPNPFDPEAVTQLTTLTQEVAAPLWDAWLLKQGWLSRQTRDALRHLWDDVYLGQCPLAEWASPRLNLPRDAGPAVRGAHLRRWLMDTLKQLVPEAHKGSPRAGRRYDVLRLTYLDNLTADEVIQKLNISRRQYFYDLKDALDTLAHLLVSAHQNTD